MDTLTFVVEMTKALAWPGTTLTIAVLYRKRLGGLLKGLRLGQLKVAGWEAKFDRIEEKVQGKVQEAVAELPVAEKPPTKFLGTFGATTDEAIPAIAIILTTWAEIEHRVREATKSGDRVTFGRMLDELVRSGRVSPATSEGLRGLQQLRNLAAHAPRDEALAARVPEFRAMAGAMLWSLEHDLKREPKPPSPSEKR